MNLLDKLAQHDPAYNKGTSGTGTGGKKLTDIINSSLKSNPNAIWNQGKGGSGKDK